MVVMQMYCWWLDQVLIVGVGLSSWFGDLGSTLTSREVGVAIECMQTIGDLHLEDSYHNAIRSSVSQFSGRFGSDVDSSLGDR